MNILITGITGFVGGYLVEHIQSLAEGHSIYGIDQGALPDCFSSLDKEIIEHIFKCDLTDKTETARIFKEVKPDIVIHLAALSSVSDAWQDSEKVLTNNIVSQLNVLEATRQANPSARVVTVSSAEVYGKVSPEQMPITEDSPLKPGNPYSISKATQEFLAYQYRDAYGLDTVIARPFNHIGPRQHGNFVVPSFAKQIAAIEAGLQPPKMLAGNLSAKRDFLDVRDVAEAYWLLASNEAPSEAYNVASGNAIAIQEILDTLLGYATVDIAVEQNPDLLRPSDVPILIGSAEKLTRATGWKPKRQIKDTLHETLDYWREFIRHKERLS